VKPTPLAISAPFSLIDTALSAAKRPVNEALLAL
jgi:hypothetical protein